MKCDECMKIQKIQKIQKTSDVEIPLKTAKTPEFSKNPTIACGKCTESSQIVLKIKNELKINQNLMSEMRKNREDADEQHKKVLEERKKEIGNLQKKIDTQTKWKNENLELKKRISEISSQKNEENLLKTVKELENTGQENEKKIENLMAMISSMELTEEKYQDIITELVGHWIEKT